MLLGFSFNLVDYPSITILSYIPLVICTVETAISFSVSTILYDMKAYRENCSITTIRDYVCYFDR